MTALYEMTGELISQLSNIQERLESGLEVHQDEIDMVINLKDDTENKAIKVAKFVKNLLSDSDQFEAEIKRMQAKKKATDNLANKLKTYLLENMQVLGIDKLGDRVFSVSIRNNPLSVNVTDAVLLPKEYQVVKVEPNKKALLDAYKKNENFNINGVAFTRTQSLKIG